jgi:hypothetical protein
MRYHPTPMTDAFQFPPKSPRTDPHKHSLALIVDVTKISNIFFRDPKNIFWGRTIAHPGCRGSFWHLLSHPRPLVADSSALFSRWRVRKSAIKALILTVPASIWASHDLSLAIQTPRVFDWVFGGGELSIGLQVMSVECPNIGLHMCAGSGTAHCQFTL